MLKHWLYDHNNAESTGGIAVFSATVLLGFDYSSIFPAGSPEAGSHYVSSWGTTGFHAMTIVGYNDDVWCFDLNGDGIYENVDLNGDGLDLSECEKGAFKVANSWGSNWADDGYVYVPYKLLSELPAGHWRAYVCHAQLETDHDLSIKASIQYPSRERLAFYIGCAADATSTGMENITNFYSFQKQGGNNIMNAPYSDEIEIGLNFDHFFNQMDFGKVYLEVDETDTQIGLYDGTINSFSFVDYRWGEVFEIECEQVNVPILNGTQYPPYQPRLLCLQQSW